MIRDSLAWIVVRGFFLIVATLAFALLAVTFPSDVIVIAAFGASLGVLFAGLSIMKGDSWWGRAALIAGAVMLGISMTLHSYYGAVLQALPALVLAYVMLLFSSEGYALVSEHQGIHSDHTQALKLSRSMVEKSLAHIIRKSSRLAALFGASYVFSLGAIFVGGVLASALPTLSDLSIYIVAVSVSLALLLILRED